MPHPQHNVFLSILMNEKNRLLFCKITKRVVELNVNTVTYLRNRKPSLVIN